MVLNSHFINSVDKAKLSFSYILNLVFLPCVKKIPPTSKSRLKGTNKKMALILGFLYPTKQIPLNEFASTYNSNIRSELYINKLYILQLLFNLHN